MDRDQIHTAIALERRRIADLIDSLDEPQLATQSLCTDWDVKTVVAHLVSALADGNFGRTLLLGLRRGSLARNSSNACATTADSVRPDAAAWVRTRAMSGTGSLTVNTAAGAGTATCPDRPARCT